MGSPSSEEVTATCLVFGVSTGPGPESDPNKGAKMAMEETPVRPTGFRLGMKSWRALVL